MKILKLNKKQEAKLLKLCTRFFPEYIVESNIKYFKEIKFTSSKFKKPFIDGCGFVVTEEPIFRYDINWYQLCLTELPSRIIECLDGIKSYNIEECFAFDSYVEPWEYSLITDIAISGHHPVDFLWNFVSGCDKNKYFKQ